MRAVAPGSSAARGGSRAAQRLGRLAQRPFVRGGRSAGCRGPLAGWTRSRDLRAASPAQSFRDWWRRSDGERRA